MHNYRLFADISSNNSKFNAKAYADAGHQLVAIKASEGLTYINPFHAGWSRNAHAAGLVVLHYHFCKPAPANGLMTQAQHFWRVVAPTFWPGDLLCLDLETSANLTPPALEQWFTRLGMCLLRVSGHHVVGYSYASFLAGSTTALNVPTGRWWVADYSSKRPAAGPHRKLWAWQYTNGVQGGSPREFAGIGSCDGSILNLPSSLRLLADAPKRRRAAARR